MEKGKEGRIFKIGDFVFAKVRGFSPWPAKVADILEPKSKRDELKYSVYFYGTYETAVIAAKDAFDYTEHKDKFCKNVKRKHFNQGIAELEKAMGNPEDDIHLQAVSAGPAHNVSLRSTSDASLVGQETKKRKLDVSEGDSQSPLRKRKKSDATSIQTSVGGTKKEKSPPREGDTHSTRKRKSIDDSDNKEQMSRSGRIIKPKKFLYDEGKVDGEIDERIKDKTVLQPDENKRNDKQGNDSIADSDKKETSKRSRNSSICQGVSISKGVVKAIDFDAAKERPVRKRESTSEPKLAKIGRLIWVKTKCGSVVQIKVDHDRPAKFKDDKAREGWEKAYEERVKEIKEKIESGEMLPPEVEVQLKPAPTLMLSDEDIAKTKKAGHVERRTGQIRWLKLESRLVELNGLLRSCLQKTKVDIDNAITYMNELINLPIDPLILKKHPHLVDTIFKIKSYHGNAESWGYSEEEEAKFVRKAAMIRDKAKIVLNKFRAVFAVPQPDDFWAVFHQSVSEFNRLIKDLPHIRAARLTVDPTSPLYKEVAQLETEDDEFKLSLIAQKEKENCKDKGKN